MTFQNKIILGIACIEAVLMAVIIWSNLSYQRRSNETALVENARMTADLFASVVKEPLLSGDLASLKSLTDELESRSAVAYARVISAMDGVLAEGGDPDALHKPFSRDAGLSMPDDVFDESAKIVVAGRPYGHVEIGLSADYIRQALKTSRYINFVLAAAGMTMSAVFSLMLGYHLIGRMNALVDAAEHISHGDLGYQIAMTGRDEVARVAAVFNQMSKDLKRSYDEIHETLREREKVDRMKNDFISTTAHELRTPLTSIQGFSEVLITRDDLQENERKKFVSYIHEKTVALSDIVDDMINIVWVESGKNLEIVKSPCDVLHMAAGLAASCQRRNPTRRFHTEWPDEPLTLDMDIVKIEQALKNILSNAVKFSPEGATISIGARRLDGHIEIAVADKGIGMTADQVEKMFDKFYRADASDTAKEGMGLGMTIARYFIEAHGGAIQVNSEPGRGTDVRVILPTENDSTV